MTAVVQALRGGNIFRHFDFCFIIALECNMGFIALRLANQIPDIFHPNDNIKYLYYIQYNPDK